MIVLFTASLWFVGPGMATLGLTLYIIANMGFAGGGVFIDSFLPGISNQSNAGRLSGFKLAMGYTSGLVAPYCVCLWPIYRRESDTRTAFEGEIDPGHSRGLLRHRRNSYFHFSS